MSSSSTEPFSSPEEIDAYFEDFGHRAQARMERSDSGIGPQYPSTALNGLDHQAPSAPQPSVPSTSRPVLLPRAPAALQQPLPDFLPPSGTWTQYPAAAHAPQGLAMGAGVVVGAGTMLAQAAVPVGTAPTRTKKAGKAPARASKAPSRRPGMKPGLKYDTYQQRCRGCNQKPKFKTAPVAGEVPCEACGMVDA